jgi:tetratricopeptide (TPR) repeat protein
VGLDLKARGDLRGALAQYSKALLVAPRNPLVHVLRGVARFEKREYVSAIKDFSEALRFQSALSKDTDALLNRAITYSVVGNDTAALRDLTLAQERDPEDPEVSA